MINGSFNLIYNHLLERMEKEKVRGEDLFGKTQQVRPEQQGMKQFLAKEQADEFVFTVRRAQVKDD